MVLSTCRRLRAAYARAISYDTHITGLADRRHTKFIAHQTRPFILRRAHFYCAPASEYFTHVKSYR